jgi:hypothetical protein
VSPVRPSARAQMKRRVESERLRHNGFVAPRPCLGRESMELSLLLDAHGSVSGSGIGRDCSVRRRRDPGGADPGFVRRSRTDAPSLRTGPASSRSHKLQPGASTARVPRHPA